MNNTDPDKNDSLIIKVAEYLPDKNYEKALKFLQNLKTGILDKKKEFHNEPRGHLGDT